MKIVCAPQGFDFKPYAPDLAVTLFSKPTSNEQGYVGKAVLEEIKRQKLAPAPKAWDFLSIALSVVTADLAGHRKKSPDGWTREFELTIAVADPSFWTSCSGKLQELLAFLTTDRWKLNFIGGGLVPEPDLLPKIPTEDCVSLLSGGLDSLVGNIDLSEMGRNPYTVTQTVRGDGHKQVTFPAEIGEGLAQFKANHNASVPKPETPSSQRARSIVFLAYGVLISSCLQRHKDGEEVELYVCENGFISINPPLTGGRVGSLSTRTTHPVVFSLLREILDLANLHISIVNPYRMKTKGEMLRECKNQSLLKKLASNTTSCGRFLVFGHKHCGRCVPCMVRRAAFLTWGETDHTEYVHENLGILNEEKAGFDDVRSALIAIYERRAQGTRRWLSASLSSSRIRNKDSLSFMIERGLEEIEGLLNTYGAK